MSTFEFDVASTDLHVGEDGLSNEGKTSLWLTLAPASYSGLEDSRANLADIHWSAEIIADVGRVATVSIPDKIGELVFRRYGPRLTCGGRLKISSARFETLVSAVIAGNRLTKLNLTSSTLDLKETWEGLEREKQAVEGFEILIETRGASR